MKTLIDYEKKINQKFGRAARQLGFLYRVSRPVFVHEPLSNVIAEQYASWSKKDDYEYSHAQDYGKSKWTGIYDATSIKEGDYFIGRNGPFFVASQFGLLPRLCIGCNRTIISSRMVSEPDEVGALPYSGLCVAEGVPTLGTLNEDGTLRYGWPASILFGNQSQKIQSGLVSGSFNQIGYEILLPNSPLLDIRNGDVLVDNLANRYQVQGVEQTNLGIRINAIEVHL